jgi:hypothetical protein
VLLFLRILSWLIFRWTFYLLGCFQKIEKGYDHFSFWHLSQLYRHHRYYTNSTQRDVVAGVGGIPNEINARAEGALHVA